MWAARLCCVSPPEAKLDSQKVSLCLYRNASELKKKRLVCVLEACMIGEFYDRCFVKVLLKEMRTGVDRHFIQKYFKNKYVLGRNRLVSIARF